MNPTESKQVWSSHCQEDDDVPVFMQPWWWDITAGEEHWEVVLAQSKKQSILGALLYAQKQFFGVKRLTLPVFTPINGVWFSKHDTDKAHSFYSKRRKILSQIIRQLPRAAFHDFKLHYTLEDWLPFKWAGYKQTTQYTQTLDLTPDETTLYEAFKGGTRSKINKVRERFEMVEIKDIKRFLDHINRVAAFKNIPYTKQNLHTIGRLHQEIEQRDLGTILAAKDEKGDIHAMIYIVFSAGTAHYWLGGAHPEFRDTNGMFFLLWEAIKKSKSRAGVFDFDGSNHPNIAPVFTGFGAIPQSNHYIYKSKNLFYKILRQIINKDGG